MEVYGPWMVSGDAIHPPSKPEAMEQYTLVLLNRGPAWDPNAAGFMEPVKQHHAFVKEKIDDGSLAIAGPLEFSSAGDLRAVEIFSVGKEETARLLEADPTGMPLKHAAT